MFDIFASNLIIYSIIMNYVCDNIIKIYDYSFIARLWRNNEIYRMNVKSEHRSNLFIDIFPFTPSFFSVVDDIMYNIYPSPFRPPLGGFCHCCPVILWDDMTHKLRNLFLKKILTEFVRQSPYLRHPQYNISAIKYLHLSNDQYYWRWVPISIYHPLVL